MNIFSKTPLPKIETVKYEGYEVYKINDLEDAESSLEALEILCLSSKKDTEELKANYNYFLKRNKELGLNLDYQKNFGDFYAQVLAENKFNL